MRLIKILRFLITAEHPHFLSVDKETYFKYKTIIKFAINLNRSYRSCEIFRKKFKTIENFVVVGLKYNGKNVKRRTSGFAKEYVEEGNHSTCIYCKKNLDENNATADHIIPISEGGNNCQVNLVVCCKKCNNERGNMKFQTYLSIKRKDIDPHKHFI